MIRLLLSVLFLLICTTTLVAQSDSAFVKLNVQGEHNFLVINSDFNNCIQFSSGDSVQVNEGFQTLKIISKYYQDINTSVSIEENGTKELTFYPIYLEEKSKRETRSSFARCFWDSNVFIISDYDSDLYFEGEKIGVENSRLMLPDGSYKTIASIGNISSTKKFTVSDNFQAIEHYIRPKKSTIYLRSFLPGYAQFSKREQLKGSLFATLSSGLVFSAIFNEHRVKQENSEYEQLRFQYAAASDPNRILEIIEESEQTLNDIDRYKKIRNYSIIGLGVTYVLNLIDGRRAPEFGFRPNNRIKINPYIDFDKTLLPNANVKIDF
ncbi:MAG: DUF5683 domain-containing protein [Vicingaceae bacterium]|jgi:hypothetical protein